MYNKLTENAEDVEDHNTNISSSHSHSIISPDNNCDVKVIYKYYTVNSAMAL